MVKILRNTNVLIVLVGILFVLTVFFGLRPDIRIKQFLNLPNVIEQFENPVDSKVRISENRTPSLVQQAETFASYLNPEQKSENTQPISRTTSVTRELAVTPQIKVLGTSYCADNPEMSFALIDEPGKGLHWVRQSSEVGHLRIQHIGNGLVTVKSSEETFELAVQPHPETSTLVRGVSPISAQPSAGAF